MGYFLFIFLDCMVIVKFGLEVQAEKVLKIKVKLH